MDLGKLNVYKFLKLAQKIWNEAYSFQLTFCYHSGVFWKNVGWTLKLLLYLYLTFESYN